MPVGSTIWAAQNVGYDTANGVYGFVKYPEQFGHRFTWAKAMCIDTKFDTETWNKSTTQTGTGTDGSICPSGWRMPNSSNFSQLTSDTYTTRSWTEGTGAGTGLKVESKTDGQTLYFPNTGHETGGGLGYEGYHWSSTEYSRIYANYLHVAKAYIGLLSYTSKTWPFPVRCVRDA